MGQLRPPPTPISILAALAAAAALVLAGCGGDEDGEEGPTRLERALERLGSGVSRVVLERPEGSQPSLLFDAFVRGSLVAYLGGDRPIPSTGDK